MKPWTGFSLPDWITYDNYQITMRKCRLPGHEHPTQDKKNPIGCTKLQQLERDKPLSLQFLPSLLLGNREALGSNGKIDVRLFQNFQLSPAAAETGGMFSIEEIRIEGLRV
jgi:hypothetical protein